MIKAYVVPFLAIIGLVFAAATVVKGSRPPNATPPVVAPPSAPYASFVAGSGIIEPSTQNIAVGTPVGGLIASVLTPVGTSVKKGDVLFTIDTRDLQSQLAAREATVNVARQALAKLEAGTRPEMIPPARARVAELSSTLEDLRSQLAMWESVTDSKAISREDLSRKRFAVEAAQARRDAAQADLALLESGSWSKDVEVARASLAQAEAEVATIRTEIERRSVRSPIDGRVLQVNVRVGEFAPSGVVSTPLMVVGSVEPLHVRVDVDEYEAWRIKNGAPATGFARGNRAISTPLEFVRFEPLIVPKRSLTGDSTERVDTRVLQVIYRFTPKDMPWFVGQQVDVFIEAAPLPEPAPVPTPSKDVKP